MIRLPWASRPVSAAHSAIIDIGSNSIRLVVYGGPERIPATLFNEKVLAGLGRSLAETGRIDPEAMALAATALRRFAWLTREMEAEVVRTVATAAVRDAANGHELVALAESLGLTVETLSGEEEAQAAGNGVLSAIPDADGIVGDLGGGSLELVRVKNGKIGDRVSFGTLSQDLGISRHGVEQLCCIGLLEAHDDAAAIDHDAADRRCGMGRHARAPAEDQGKDREHRATLPRRKGAGPAKSHDYPLDDGLWPSPERRR